MLTPGQYTIDGGGENLSPNVAYEIVGLCDRFGFARVVEVFDDAHLDRLTRKADAYYAHAERADALLPGEQDGDNYTLAPTSPRHLHRHHPGLVRIAFGITSAIHAASTDSERMWTPHAALHGCQVNNYPVGGEVVDHMDGESGVAAVVSYRGEGETTLSRRVPQEGEGVASELSVTIAEFISGPNELLVLPATAGRAGRERGGRFDQIFHRVVNVTPIDKAEGVRRTLALLYGYNPEHSGRDIGGGTELRDPDKLIKPGSITGN